MMKLLYLFQSHRYTTIEAEIDQTPENSQANSKLLCLKQIPATCGLLLWTIAVAYSSFRLGGESVALKTSNGVRLEILPQAFVYNRTFGEVPTHDTDKAWRDLFPHNGPFFEHPVVSPALAVHSVWHQLHCLNGIRHGYWAMHQYASKGTMLTGNDSLGMGSEPHVRHCLDLLRQTLLCHADTTVEVVDQVTKGVSGFGVEHQCKDWEHLKEWTEKWRFEPKQF